MKHHESLQVPLDLLAWSSATLKPLVICPVAVLCRYGAALNIFSIRSQITPSILLEWCTLLRILTIYQISAQLPLPEGNGGGDCAFYLKRFDGKSNFSILSNPDQWVGQINESSQAFSSAWSSLCVRAPVLPWA